MRAGLISPRALVRSGKRVFLDAKLLDIDNTVEGAVRSIAAMGVTFLTIHAYPKAMRAAVAARGRSGLQLLGVTVLTSMDDGDVERAGYAGGAATLVERRAADARAARMDGIVASPAEAAAVRRVAGPDMLIVTPGIRPAGAAAGDQKRVATPAAAIRAGADYLVVGRPVTTAPDPNGAAGAIVAEIEAAMAVSLRRSMNMAKGYWIARIDVHDNDGYARLRRGKSRDLQEIRRQLPRPWRQTRNRGRCEPLPQCGHRIPRLCLGPRLLQFARICGEHEDQAADVRAATSSSSRAMTARSPDILPPRLI